MQRELPCPEITSGQAVIGYGGNQEWFSGKFQRLAGCASVTGSNIAAIYAASDRGMDALYQPEADPYSQKEYLKLMETMYDYMKPGFMGYPLIGRFAGDFIRYAKERGISLTARKMFLPKDQKKALDFIMDGIRNGDPIAFLILRHPSSMLREDNWHWVTITGYDEEKRELIWSNCGERGKISWDLLFDPNRKYYVGMVRFLQISKKEEKKLSDRHVG